MPRPATGSLRVKTISNGKSAYYARFSAYGKRYELLLGHSPEWSEDRAEAELDQIIKDIARKQWTPPTAEPNGGADSHDFTDFASLYWALVEQSLADKTKQDYLLRLQNHILPFFDGYTLEEITKSKIDEFRLAQQKAGLSASYINSQIRLIAQVLDLACDRDILVANVARGKRRMARDPQQGREAKPFLTYDQVEALLEAGRELELEARDDYSRIGRPALLATLFLGGLRVSEVCALKWQDIDLANGIITIRQSKTAAGLRSVLIGTKLIDELKAFKARADNTAPSALVFPTAIGRKQRTRGNVRQRILQPAIKRANDNLTAAGQAALPDKLGTHDGRRTFISWSLEAGESPRRVMSQVGHTTARLTLELYARTSELPTDPRVIAAMARP